MLALQTCVLRCALSIAWTLTCQTASSAMNVVAPQLAAKARSPATVVAGTSTCTLAPRPVNLGGRGKSVGISSSSGASASCCRQYARCAAPRPTPIMRRGPYVVALSQRSGPDRGLPCGICAPRMLCPFVITVTSACRFFGARSQSRGCHVAPADAGKRSCRHAALAGHLRLQLAALQACALPGGVVRVLDGQGRQIGRRGARAQRVVHSRQLAVQHAHAPAVAVRRACRRQQQ